MDRFLASFADELIKVAAPWGGASAAPPAAPKPMGVVRPPSTGAPGAPVPKPINSMGAANSRELLGAIPTQKMESPAKTTPQTWRPSPGYRPSTAGDPKPPVAKPPQGGGGRRGPGADPGVAWENAKQRKDRMTAEAVEKSKPLPGPTQGVGADAARRRTPAQIGVAGANLAASGVARAAQLASQAKQKRVREDNASPRLTGGQKL